MTWVGVGVAAVGVGTQVVGGIQAGNAARSAAGEQEARAQDWMNYVKDQEHRALDLVKSPAQIASFDQALRAQQANVQRQEALVKNIDPALISAGKQTMDILNGKSAPVLANLQTQRNAQREQFVNDLTAKYGPGAASSALGMQQLQKFDLQTADLMNQAQQGYLDKVSNLSLGGMNASAISTAVNKGLADLNSQSPDVQAAKLIADFTGQQAGPHQAQIQAAGASAVGDEIQGQMIGSVGSGITTLGGLYAGKQMGNPTKPGTPAAATTPSGSVTPMNPGLAMNPDIGGAPQTLGGAVGSPAAARSAGVGVPTPGYAGPLSPNYQGYSGPSTSNAYKPFSLEQAMNGIGSPNYSNIAGGQ